MTAADNEHEWFAERLAASLAGGLDAAESERFDAHARACSDCAKLLAEAKTAEAAITAALADLQPTPGLEARIMSGIPAKARFLRYIGISHPLVERAAAVAAAAILVGTVGYYGMQRATPYLNAIPQLAIASQERERALRDRVEVQNVAPDEPVAARPSATPQVSPPPAPILAAKDVPDVYKANAVRLPAGTATTSPVASMGEELAKNSDGTTSNAGTLAITSAMIASTPGASLSLAGANTYSGPVQIAANPAPSPVTGGELSIGANNSPTFVGPGTLELAGNNTYKETTTPVLAGAFGGGRGGAGGGGGGGGGGFGGGSLQITNNDAGAIANRSDTGATADSAAAAKSTPSGVRSSLAFAPSAAIQTPGARVPDAFQPATAARPEAAATATPPSPDATNTPPQAPAATDRKIIRTGEMEFEVDKFDAAYQRLDDIVREGGGYVGSTNSDRLPNGKVRGSVTVRMPPENLDTLVMKLRALGDLKQQKIDAQDITKEYTDLQSELRAATTMEDRLLEIIRTGKGEVKDLVAAEQEVGVWREKVEQVTGQINYYNNLVALSTLQITLEEKDIAEAATVRETETIDAALEADDVSRARDEVFKAIDAAKGRVIRSELRQQEAGEFTASVVAAIPPDGDGGGAGAVLDRLHQLGRVARLQSSRQQTGADPTGLAGAKVEQRESVLNLSIFNSAAYAAKTTDNLQVACEDVEAAYRAIVDFAAKSDGGRVVNSNLDKQDTGASATINFEVRESAADAALALVRSRGDVLQMTAQDNPDQAGNTSSKRAFVIVLTPLNNIAPQETDELTILPRDGDLQAAYNAILEFVAKPDSKTRVIEKDLQQDNGQFTSAGIVMEVSRQTLAEADGAIASAGKTIARKATRQPDSPSVVDSKVLLKFTFVNVAALEPRETLSRVLVAANVPGGYQALLDLAKASHAIVRTAILHQQPGQPVSGELEFDLPATQLPAMEQAIGQNSMVLGASATHAPESEGNTDSKVRLHLELIQADQVPPRRTYVMEIQTAQPQAAADAVIKAALAGGGEIVQHSSSTDADGHSSANLIVQLPLTGGESVALTAAGEGKVRINQSNEDPQAPTGRAARARLELTFASQPSLVTDDNGLAATVEQALATSLHGLIWSVRIVLVGLCLVGPLALAAWATWIVGRWILKSRRVRTADRK